MDFIIKFTAKMVCTNIYRLFLQDGLNQRLIWSFTQIHQEVSVGLMFNRRSTDCFQIYGKVEKKNKKVHDEILTKLVKKTCELLNNQLQFVCVLENDATMWSKTELHSQKGLLSS